MPDQVVAAVPEDTAEFRVFSIATRWGLQAFVKLGGHMPESRQAPHWPATELPQTCAVVRQRARFN
jgi:hypothetical protein